MRCEEGYIVESVSRSWRPGRAVLDSIPIWPRLASFGPVRPRSAAVMAGAGVGRQCPGLFLFYWEEAVCGAAIKALVLL
jgi:hypothetical protein